MKSIMTVGIVLALTAAANAGIVLQDDFSNNGNLVTSTPDVGTAWVAHSGAGSTPIGVSAAGATLAQGSGSREDANAGFAGGEVAGAGEQFYASFSITVTGADPVTSTYFAHFSDAGTSAFAGRVGVIDGTSDFKFAIFSGSTATAAVYPTETTFGSTHTVVVSYNYDDGLTQLWVDPVAGLGENDLGQAAKISGTLVAATAIKAFAFRQAGGNTVEVIDDLVVGTSWADVVVPEPTAIAFLGLGGLTLLRRRR